MQLIDQDNTAITKILKNEKTILVYIVCVDHHNNMGHYFLQVLYQNKNNI